MENQTFREDVLYLEGLKVTNESSLPAFIILLIIYIIIIISNLTLMALIFKERSLHQPMYLLRCNMSVNDILGATVVIPPLLSDVFVVNTERFIGYIECVVQAFFAHLYGSTAYTVLMVMAFDRYVAICNPLRYATIMDNKMVVKLTVFAWGVTLVLVGILLALTIRLTRCRWMILNPYCDNASLFKLSCQNVFVNNIYGLCYTVLLLGSSIGSTALTYLKIAIVCLSGKNKAINSRALQTCTTHLAVYVILLISGFTIVFLHRYPHWADHRKLAGIMGHVVPPVLNPVIYGLQIKEIRLKITGMFCNNRVAAAAMK